MRVLIYGSCVSRDIFNFDSAKKFVIVDYIARSSLASSFGSGPVEDSFSERLASPFQRKLVRCDFEKTFPKNLRGLSFDIFLFDLIDERFSLFHFDDGRLCTISSELASAGFKGSSMTGNVVASGTDSFFSLWEAGWQVFVAELRSMGCLSKLRINKVFWSSHKEDGTLFEVGADEVRKRNAFLDVLYARIALDVPSEQFYSYSGASMVGAVEHKWGPSPFHYVDAYYLDALGHLNREAEKRMVGSGMLVGITRFSVYSPGSGAWHLSKGAGSLDAVTAYKAALYSEARMEERFAIFFGISVPMLARMRTGHDYIHIIQYSECMPDVYRERLVRLAGGYDFLRLQRMTDECVPDVSLNRIILSELGDKRSDVVGLFNLDDDDLLSVEYFKSATEYLTDGHVGKVVSFGLGVSGYLDERLNFSNVREVYHPKINIGMLRIGRIDREKGSLQFPLVENHAFVDRYTPTILDSRKVSFFWVRHLNQDSARSLSEVIAQRNNIMNDLDHYRKFESLEGIQQLFPEIHLAEIDADFIEAPLREELLTKEFLMVDFGGGVSGNVELTYHIECPDSRSENPRGLILSYVVEGEMGDGKVAGLVRSNDPDIGFFRYIKTTQGKSEGTATVLLPHGVVLKGIRIKPWSEGASVYLKAIRYRSF